MEKFKDVSPFTIIEYIRSTVDILLNLKETDSKKPSIPQTCKSINQNTETTAADYEKLLQHAEEELRNHVRVF